MANLLSSLLGLLVSSNPPAVASNLVYEKTGARVEVASATNSPVERELQELLAKDDEAQAEVDRWIRDNAQLVETGAGLSQEAMSARIRQRFQPVEKAYEDFLQRHPRHAEGWIAYGSFLGDLGREEEATEKYLKAREIDPKNPAAWNNLANLYGHNGPVTNAFICYEKAIELRPNEPVYYQNLATTVYLFRRDATNHYHISEQQVFDKAMALYRKALSLDPTNFPLATDLAQTYYGIQPPRAADASLAWSNALKLARDDIEREGVYLHLARWHRTAGDLDAARRELERVTNGMYQVTKERILKSLRNAETNSPPAARK
jgi:tetratricopeptide (TPR) repeat protein